MRFAPFVPGKEHTKISAMIVPMSARDALETRQEPEWQIGWTSEYIAESRFDTYSPRLCVI